MKYTVLINMAGIYDAGLVDKTDWNDWAILEYIRDWQAHSSSIRYGDHVWLNYKNLMAEIPMLTFKSKSGITTRIARLRDLDLISTLQTDDNRLFVRVTDFYMSVSGFRPSGKMVDDAQPRPLKREQGVLSAEQGVLSAEHSINNNINNNKQTKLLAGAQAQEEGESFSDDHVFAEALEWVQFFINECRYPFHIAQTAKTVPLFAQWVSEKTTVGEIRQAMAACHGWNHGRIPDSPLLYGKFLQSVRGECKRLIDEKSFATRPGIGRSRQVEEWAKIPRGDDELWPWAKKHGYPDPGSMTYRQYRARLQAFIESRLSRSEAG